MVKCGGKCGHCDECLRGYHYSLATVDVAFICLCGWTEAIYHALVGMAVGPLLRSTPVGYATFDASVLSVTSESRLFKVYRRYDVCADWQFHGRENDVVWHGIIYLVFHCNRSF